MSSVDNRVVQMEFDNSKFESKVKDTLTSLTNLDKGLEKLNDFDGGKISSALEGVSERFSNLGVIGMSVLQNLTSRAVDAGINFAESLSVDQVTAGWERFNNETKNTKAIMNQLNIGVDEATSELSKLTWYSDATSYSYDAMTTAFKQFSAQDIAPDISIPMIMGIGNSLSYAGLAAEEASRGFEIYSRALGMGFMDSLTFKSLNNMSAMTSGLRKQFMDAAVALGTLQKQGDKYFTNTGGNEVEVSAGSFKDTLYKQWLSNDVMKAVLGIDYGSYTKELYDYMQANSDMNYTLDEAITALAKERGEFDEFGLKALKAAGDARTLSEAIGSVKDAAQTKWKEIFRTLFGDADQATRLFTDLGNTLYDKFITPLINANELVGSFKKYNGVTYLIAIFKELGKVIESIKSPIKEAFTTMFGSLNTDEAGKKLAVFMVKITNFVQRLKLSEDVAGKLKRVFEGVFATFDSARIIVKNLIDALSPLNNSILKPIASKILDISASIGDFLVAIRNYLAEHTGFFDAIKSLSGLFNDLRSGVNSVLGFFKNVLNWISDFLKNLKTRLSGVFDFLKTAFEKIKEFILKLKDLGLGFDLSTIFKVGANAGIFAMVIKRLSSIGKTGKSVQDFLDNLAKSIDSGIGSIKKAFGSLTDMLNAIAMSSKVDAILKLAIAIGILTASMLFLATLDWDSLARGLSGISGAAGLLIGSLLAAEKIFNGNKKGGLGGFISEIGSSLKEISGTALILGFAASILILAAACKVFASMSWEDLAKGAAAIAVLGGVLIGFAYAMQNVKALPFAIIAAGILVLSAAILVMSIAFKIFGSMDWNQLAVAGAAIGGLALIVAILVKIFDTVSAVKILTISIALIAMSAALLIAVVALTAFSLMSWEGIEKAGVALGGLALILIIFMKAIESMNVVKLIGASAAMIIMAAALVAIAVACLMISMMSWDGVLKAIVVIAAVAAVLVIVGYAAAAVIGYILLFAAALLVVSVALIASAAAFILFGVGLLIIQMLDGQKIGDNIMAMLIPLSLFAAVALALGLAAPGLLIFAVGLLVLAAAVLLLSVGLSYLGGMESGEFAILAVALAAITVLALALASSLGVLDLALIPLLVELVAADLELLVFVVNATLASAAAATVAVTIGLLDAAIVLLAASITLLAVAISVLLGNFKEIKEKVGPIITDFKETIVNKFREIKDKFKTIAHDCLTGFVNGIKEKISTVVDAVKGVGQKVVGGLKNVLGINSPSKVFAEIGRYSDEGFAKGLTKYSDISEEAAGDVGTNAAEALEKSLASVSDIASNELDSPVITPVLDLTEIQNGSRNLNRMFSNPGLSAELTSGIGSGIVSNAQLSSKIASMNEFMTSMGMDSGLDNIGEMICEALNHANVYMDKDKVGSLITNYQYNMRKAGGY